MKVLILGCGPAGLFAAKAAVNLLCQVSIVSKKRRSEMFGAQYLHKPVPGLSDLGNFREIKYELRGTPEQYREKVYGDRAVMVSPETLTKSHRAWDIREAYYRAYAKFENWIIDTRINGPQDLLDGIELLQQQGGSFDLLINTIPMTMLCRDQDRHVFKSEDAYAIGDAPERGIECPITVPPDTVICNGEPSPAWYRAANVFGYRTVEWPSRRKPPFENVSLITKPLSTTCDCWPEMLRLGRYGKWTKGVLSHEAYWETINKIREMRIAAHEFQGKK
jgi:hypothetical protein